MEARKRVAVDHDARSCGCGKVLADHEKKFGKCDECVESAELPPQTPRAKDDDAAERFFHRTWSEHTGNCQSCGEDFRVSVEAIKEMRETGYEDEDDRYIANSMEFCLHCVSGIDIVGEKVLDARRITLKSYKEHKQLSEETTAYTTKIALDGKVIGDAKNDGHGGSDRVYIDKDAREIWRKIVGKWSTDNNEPFEPDAAFIAELAKILGEKKMAKWLFKKDERTTVVVAVDDGKQTIGESTFYTATNFHTYASIANVATIHESIDRQYKPENPRRIYTPETV